MKDTYLSIEAPSKGTYREKGSRFLAFAFPVDCEEEIKSRVTELRKEHHGARHHCFAWRLGSDMERFRINDDGEPSGSAGKPIFGQLESRSLTNVLIVVVRYFGGTLLGVGGLIKAYRAATVDALDQASIIKCRVKMNLQLNFGYGQMNEIMRIIKELKLEISRQDFDLDCVLELSIWIRIVPEVNKRFSKIEGCKMLYL